VTFNHIAGALSIALTAHNGQTDKHGKIYITHPLRVAGRLNNYSEICVAILHDVVEDSDITLDYLRKWGFDEEIIAAVDAISRREDESYKTYLKRCAQNPLALRVKLADLEDNTDPNRILPESNERYIAAQRFLEKVQAQAAVEGRHEHEAKRA
jgi:(p)ppGpp synthase/HD superfamily hydrolase